MGGRIAQSVEHLQPNQAVARSSPLLAAFVQFDSIKSLIITFLFCVKRKKTIKL